MKYSELVATNIKSSEDYEEAFRLLSHEFTEHEETNLRFYDYVVLVKYKNRGVGVVTGMRHLPSKVIITDIVVDEQYRGQAIGLKLLTAFWTDQRTCPQKILPQHRTNSLGMDLANREDFQPHNCHYGESHNARNIFYS